MNCFISSHLFLLYTFLLIFLCNSKLESQTFGYANWNEEVLSGSWQDPNNWWPQVVPEGGPNFFVGFSLVDINPLNVHSHSNVTIEFMDLSNSGGNVISLDFIDSVLNVKSIFAEDGIILEWSNGTLLSKIDDIGGPHSVSALIQTGGTINSGGVTTSVGSFDIDGHLSISGKDSVFISDRVRLASGSISSVTGVLELSSGATLNSSVSVGGKWNKGYGYFSGPGTNINGGLSIGNGTVTISDGVSIEGGLGLSSDDDFGDSRLEMTGSRINMPGTGLFINPPI